MLTLATMVVTLTFQYPHIFSLNLLELKPIFGGCFIKLSKKNQHNSKFLPKKFILTSDMVLQVTVEIWVIPCFGISTPPKINSNILNFNLWKFHAFDIFDIRLLMYDNFSQKKRFNWPKILPSWCRAVLYTCKIQKFLVLNAKLFHANHLYCFEELKICVRYIFTSLLCMPKREDLWNKEKCFLFHFECSFRSWDNQILNFHIFKCHDIIKCLSMKHDTHFIE